MEALSKLRNNIQFYRINLAKSSQLELNKKLFFRKKLRKVFCSWKEAKQNNKLLSLDFVVAEEEKKIRHCNKILYENKHWIKSQARTLTHCLENIIVKRLSHTMIQIRSVIIVRKELIIKLLSKFGQKDVVKQKWKNAFETLREFN
jgi:hypothetical protein